MSRVPTPNPFLRGFRHLVVSRSLCIARSQGGPLLWRRVHPSQAHLSDDQLAASPCLFGSNFALVTSQTIPDDLLAEFPASGTARGVVYALTGDDDGEPIHLGDVYSARAARQVVRRLDFNAALHSRCWEINTAHLTAEAERYLTEQADQALAGILFIPFRIPHGPAVGVKLLDTPWTDTHLIPVNGITAEELRGQHWDFGVPDTLADMLHLAASAEARLLVFDAAAPVLDGLPVYDEA
jgi:hypothetical protein